MPNIVVRDKEYQVRGYGYIGSDKKDTWLDDEGNVCDLTTHERPRDLVLLIRPVPKRHTLNGIVWEEVGDTPCVPVKGEWFLKYVVGVGLQPVVAAANYVHDTYIIVRPVGIA